MRRLCRVVKRRDPGWVRFFSSIPPLQNNSPPSTPTPEELHRLLTQILTNQELLMQSRQKSAIGNYITMLEVCTSFAHVMECSRQALVHCGIPDEVACDLLKSIENDNPVGLLSFVPFAALGVVVTLPTVIVWATFDPKGFFVTFCDSIQSVTNVDVRDHSWDTMEPLGFAIMSILALVVSGNSVGNYMKKLGIRKPGYRLEKFQIYRVMAKLDSLNISEDGVTRKEIVPMKLIQAIAFSLVPLDTLIYRWMPLTSGMMSVRIFPWSSSPKRVLIRKDTPRGVSGLLSVYFQQAFQQQSPPLKSK